MEVHPPEHGIHSWRDFLVHMGTITLGLLIALSLEGLLEYQHHRHLVHTAHSNLQEELQGNRLTLERDEEVLNRIREDLDTDLKTLRGLPSGADREHAKLMANWSWDSLSDSGYNTARNTGAFTYMSYENVQNIDQVYTQQRLVDRAALEYIAAVSRIRMPLQGGRTLAEATPADTAQMVKDASDALIKIEFLRDLIGALKKNYGRAAFGE